MEITDNFNSVALRNPSQPDKKPAMVPSYTLVKSQQAGDARWQLPHPSHQEQGWPHADHPQCTILAGKSHRQLGNAMIQRSPAATLVSHNDRCRKTTFPPQGSAHTSPAHTAAAESEHHVKTLFSRGWTGQTSTTSLWCPQPLHQVFKMEIKSPSFRWNYHQTTFRTSSSLPSSFSRGCNSCEQGMMYSSPMISNY